MSSVELVGRLLLVGIGLLALLAFFALPILAGRATPPSSLEPRELGDFVGSILAYWIELARYALEEVKGAL